jgi:hypothetical protein
MSNNRYVFVSFLLIIFLFLACQNENPISTSKTDLDLKSSIEQSDVPPGQLTEAERDGLIHMRLEEKVARDVYIVLGDLWNNKVFLNIQLSEQRHMDAMKRLLEKYNVEDPVTSNEVGVFSDPDFQQLYDGFVLQGQISLHEALLAGKAIEELDIADLEFQLTFVDNPDIVRVYTNLVTASQSHLAAFLRCLINSTQPPVG